jgi:DNA-binding CsgD family transcriptional regulator
MGPARAPGEILDRSAELAAIAAAVGSAMAGSGSIVLVEGVAGIGKTRLLAHACDQGIQSGLRVLTARAAEFEAGFAWGVVRQLFEPALRADGTGRSGTADDRGTGSLPEGAAALAAAALSDSVPRGDQDSFAVLHGLYWLTVTMAQQAPLLLAVDDLHWADEPSQRFVAHLAHRLDGLPVLLVLTARESATATPPAAAQVAGLAGEPGSTVLRPAVLGAAACAEIVRGYLDEGRRGGGGQDRGGQDRGRPGGPADAFLAACRELTGGNPLLLHALAASLAAEGIRGSGADIPHLRRLTPGTVSRSVLLQLGRMPAAALAAARAVAVLGTAASTGRAARLAGLGAAECAEAISALMAERLIEGEHALSFVHPLVRSAVYQDFAPPLRQRWHARAARMLDGEGAEQEEVTVHLLAASRAGDPWLASRLQRAAADARSRGAPDVARLCLERALAEPPPDASRTDVLLGLGQLETMQAPAAAAGHLAEALAGTTDWPRRGEVALSLSEALALGGRFADAVGLLAATAAEPGGDARSRASLEAALLNTARMDIGTRAVTQPLLARIQARAAAGRELEPELHANLAIELAAAGTDRERAVWHAREAVKAMPVLMSASTAALPETISVLLFAGHAGEARAAAQAWLQLAQQQGSQPSAAVPAALMSLILMYMGEAGPAVAFGQQAIAGTGNVWISTITSAFVVQALADRGEIGQAGDLLAGAGLSGELPPTWPHNLVRHARGCLHAAAGDHLAAIGDLLKAGELAEQWGICNPAIMPWRSAAALSLAARGDRSRARQLCAAEIELARRWGAARAVGVALRAGGVAGGGADGGGHGSTLLSEAASVLRQASAPLELARALTDLGAALRRSGSRAQAREHLREGLDIAHGCGGIALAGRARDELIVAGGRPRRDALRGRDALTPSELRVAQLAAAGQTNRQIAQALFVTQRTVENHLTSTYAKLGISSRPALAAALGSGQAAGLESG